PFPTAAAARNAVLGFRPEDARVVEPGSGLLDARVFTAELTGDMTLVTLSVGQEDTVVAKMPRDFMCDYDANVGVDVDRDRIFLFDGDGGERLDTAVAAGGSTPALAND
ncbi:MAG: TOBE domain-containing protein, partial [Alphaproteobacteria bacterium]